MADDADELDGRLAADRLVADRSEAGRLDADRLAAATGTTTARIGELVAAGILRPLEREVSRRGDDSPAGDVFVDGDVQRVLVALALDEAGLSIGLLRRGIEAGVVSFEDTDRIYAAPGPLAGTVADAARELGVDTDTLLRVITAFGIARPEAETRLHTPDVEHLRTFVRAWRQLGDDDLLVRVARAYGDGLRRIAESWTSIFDDVVLAPLSNRSLSWEQMREVAFVPGLEVLTAGRAMLPWLLDRHLFHMLNQLNFDSIERQLALLEIATPAPREASAIVFSDLVGFTRLTEEAGDIVAADAATRLAVVADEVARRHGGRLVKLLGDGVMLHFEDPAAALAAALDVRAAMAPSALPAAHTGIAAGPVIRRESDYFGRVVNLAARLAAAAGHDEILVDAELAAILAARDGDAPELLRLEPLALKGIPQPVVAYRVVG